MRIFFFTMRDFVREGGGTIRMYGVLNSLATKGNDVVLISNAQNVSKFHSTIKHIYIGYEFKHKSKFQGLLGLLPVYCVYRLYPSLFGNIERALKVANIKNEKMVFCEYLDNSIAYVLKKRNRIKRYTNDLHGIATIEFKYQYDNARSLKEKIVYGMKYKISSMLDKKVFNYGDGFIYSSKAMKVYYEEAYSKVKSKRAYVLPNLLSDDACKRKVDENLKQDLLKRLKVDPSDFIFLFAGGFKPTAGVDILIQVFAQLHEKYPEIKMILIGEGPLRDSCINLVNKLDLSDWVSFISRVPYEKLFTYQSISHVIVCPDKKNAYSELIVHLKYFDALISDRLVVNGSFSSVREININDFLSLSFEPSNQKSLYTVLENCIANYAYLFNRYKNSRDYVCNHLTYDSAIDVLIQNE